MREHQRRLRGLAMPVAVATAMLLQLVWAALGRVEPRLLLGLRSTHLGGFVIINPAHADALALRNISLHIVVPTVGRKSIFKLLKSLEPQLSARDTLTVSFDGQDIEDVFTEVTQRLQKLPGSNKAIMEKEISKQHGNPLRNKYRTQKISAHGKGDFVLFADDDNWYTNGALQRIRETVQHDLDALYIFQIEHATNHKKLPNLDFISEIVVGNVDSACGVVPVHQAHQSDWVSSADYEADAFFYRELSERLPRTYFVPHVIYQYSGSEHQREGELQTIWDLPSG